jgi:hypothetical protein
MRNASLIMSLIGCSVRKGYNNDGVYVPLANGVGSIWEQLKTMDRINTEIGGDIERLIILHDSRRWPSLKLVREIEGFRILKAS